MMRKANSLRSEQKFRLHPLIHTLLEFNLTQNMVTCQRLLPYAMLLFPSDNQGESEVIAKQKAEPLIPPHSTAGVTIHVDPIVSCSQKQKLYV